MRKARKILVVEDDADSREGLAHFLETEGYGVTVAQTGDAALSAIKREVVDIVFCDLRMPGLTGIDVLKEVRKEKVPPVFVIITAYGDCENYYEIMSLGAFEYLNKPVRLDEVRRLLDKIEERLS